MVIIVAHLCGNVKNLKWMALWYVNYILDKGVKEVIQRPKKIPHQK